MRQIDDRAQRPITEQAARLTNGGADEIFGRIELGNRAESAALESRQVEQIADEARQTIGLLFDRLGGAIALHRLTLRQRFDRRERGAQVVRYRGEHDVLQSVGLAQRFGVLGFGHESHAVDSERRIVRDGVEESPLRRIELDDHAVGDGENADHTTLDGQRIENLLNAVDVIRGHTRRSPSEAPISPDARTSDGPACSSARSNAGSSVGVIALAASRVDGPNPRSRSHAMIAHSATLSVDRITSAIRASASSARPALSVSDPSRASDAISTAAPVCLLRFGLRAHEQVVATMAVTRKARAR